MTASHTPAQLEMYCSEEANIEAELAQGGGGKPMTTHPKTGHRIAHVGSMEEALKLIERSKENAGT